MPLKWKETWLTTYVPKATPSWAALEDFGQQKTRGFTASLFANATEVFACQTVTTLNVAPEEMFVLNTSRRSSVYYFNYYYT